MRLQKAVLIAIGAMAPMGSIAQRPGSSGGDSDAFVARLISFDKNKDGKLTRAEGTDARLKSLFDRADTNKDGIVTKEELKALAGREAPRFQAGGPGGPPGGFGPGGPVGPGFGPGPGGPDGPGGFGPGGPGGFGGPGGRRFGGPPRPGQILPGFLQDSLGLSAQQKKQLDQLQKEVDAKLGKILTAEQTKQLSEFRDRGPGGPGFGAGPGGPGGPGGFGPPPGGPGGFGKPPNPPGGQDNRQRGNAPR